MGVKLRELPDRLDVVSFPTSREFVADEHGDIVVSYSNGEERLANLLADSGQERYDSVDDLMTDVQNSLPRDAVGEPYQSEGEG